MRDLGAETDAAEVEKAIAFIASLIDAQDLERRWSELVRQRCSVLRKENVEQVHALELAHHDAVKAGALELGWPSPNDNPALLRFYAFAVCIWRLQDSLSQQAQHRLTGSLRGSYGTRGGLRPLAYEMTIVQHLSRVGFRIEFHDLEGTGGFDFLATHADGTTIEVECKHLSADVGRKVHRSDAYMLLELLQPLVVKKAKTAVEGETIVIDVPDRLESSRSTMEKIVSVAASAFEAQSGHAANSIASISLINEHEGERGMTWNSGLHFGARLGNLGIIIKSAQGDRVLETIEKKLKREAARQFSASRPSILFAQISDLTATELVELQRSEKRLINPFQQMASTVLKDREHLSAVSLTTFDEPIVEVGVQNAVADHTISYSFTKLEEGDPAYGAVRVAIQGVRKRLV